MSAEESTTPAITPVVKAPEPKASKAAVDFHIAPENRVPGLWEITSNEDGTITAKHSMTGQTFVGEMADFNKAMSFKA
jgi:hypothetical protein